MSIRNHEYKLGLYKIKYVFVVQNIGKNGK